MLTKALAILLSLALLGAGIQSYRLTTTQADLAVATSASQTTAGQLTTCQSTNRDEHANVLTLQAKLAAAVGQNQQTEAARAQAEADKAQALHDRDAALADLQRQRSATYATDPDAHAWADRPLPAAVSDGLRDQWAAAAADRAFHAD